MSIQFENQHLDVIGSDQHLYRLLAKRDGQIHGQIDYSVSNNQVYIDMIEVLQKREGIGSALAYHLQSLFPELSITWGYLSEEGTAFYNSLAFIDVPSSECDKFNEMNELKKKLNEIKAELEERMNNGGHDDVTFELWNQYHEIEYEIEDLSYELAGKSATSKRLNYAQNTYGATVDNNIETQSSKTTSGVRNVLIFAHARA